MLNRVLVIPVVFVAVCLFVATQPCRAEQQEQALDAGLVNLGYAENPAWFANSFLDIREDVS